MTTWNELHMNRPWGSWPNEALVRFVKGHWLKQSSCRPLKSLRVLELGCGAGANLRLFGEEGIAAAGIDMAPAAIERASKRLDSWFPRQGNINTEGGDSHAPFDLRVGDVRQLPWPDKTFDLVTDIETVAYLNYVDAREAYAEAWRVAGEGCFLFVRTFTVGTFSGNGEVNNERSMLVPSDGPLSGTPPFRITIPADLEELLGNWSIETIETECRISGVDQPLVSELVVTAQKQ